jgi:hypothetical protein
MIVKMKNDAFIFTNGNKSISIKRINNKIIINNEFDENAHPRDEKGRFTDKFPQYEYKQIDDERKNKIERIKKLGHLELAEKYEQLLKTNGKYKKTDIAGYDIPVKYMFEGKEKTSLIRSNEKIDENDLKEYVLSNMNGKMRRVFEKEGEKAFKIGQPEVITQTKEIFRDNSDSVKKIDDEVDFILKMNYTPKDYTKYKENRENIIQQIKDESLMRNKESYLAKEGAYNGTNFDGEQVRKTIRKSLKSMGWSPYYVSGKRVGETSSYYEKNGKTLRLSDHLLPQTAERKFKKKEGLSKGWDAEIITTQRLIDSLSVAKNKEDFEKILKELIA